MHDELDEEVENLQAIIEEKEEDAVEELHGEWSEVCCAIDIAQVTSKETRDLVISVH
ncbi:hypothetical protein [Rhodohalobacter sp. 8-1]|uniref:hypothetical protein n=1 Tax=Rhodohalobacter sp. 8-1 TaxID=3131972 RepID=UPI0030EED57F